MKLSTMNLIRKLVKKEKKILQPWRGTYLSIYGKIIIFYPILPIIYIS
jgi:hypothetical protein